MNPSVLLRILPLAATLLAAPLALAVTEQTTTTYAWTPRLSLTVINSDGNVRVSTWDRDEVEVTVVKTAATSALLENLRTQVEESANALRLEARRAAFSWVTKKARDARIDYEIRVPAALTRCVVRIDTGQATVDGLAGAVEFRGGIASFKARNLRGSLSAQTDIGRIDVGFAELANSQQVDARTRNGSIKFFVPTAADAQLDAKAELARIDCKIPVQIQRADELVHQVLVGGWGNRAGKVTLRSSKGPIIIDRA